MFTRCRVVGCSRPAGAGTGDGLDTRFCRSHADHYARHGSPYKPSYGAREVNPYRVAALAWLEANPNDTYVANAVGAYGRREGNPEAVADYRRRLLSGEIPSLR